MDLSRAQRAGVKIAAKTYRSWRQGRIATRTVSDALVMDAVREIAWKDHAFSDGTPRRVLTPEGLYGRKKMTVFVRLTKILDASRGAVDRAMHALGLSGITRAKGIRTTAQSTQGQRAADLLGSDARLGDSLVRQRVRPVDFGGEWRHSQAAWWHGGPELGGSRGALLASLFDEVDHDVQPVPPEERKTPGLRVLEVVNLENAR